MQHLQNEVIKRTLIFEREAATSGSIYTRSYSFPLAPWTVDSMLGCLCASVISVRDQQVNAGIGGPNPENAVMAESFCYVSREKSELIDHLLKGPEGKLSIIRWNADRSIGIGRR